jgi:hypothetical protein
MSVKHRVAARKVSGMRRLAVMVIGLSRQHSKPVGEW